MTQNTQTTAERIFALIFENIGYTDGDDRTVAAIAAEIDALTAERDEALAKVADWEREEKLAEIANTQINLHYAEVAKNRELTAQLAEIDGLAAELARRTLERDAAQETLVMVSNMAKANLDAKDAQLAEARAEVERLRLPAEAWEALDAAVGDVDESAKRLNAAYTAARARAAKGTL